MKLKHRPRSGRTGFTLIELLVVMAIIAVLVSLTAAAVFKLLGKGPETQRRSDISQMYAALAQFKSKFGVEYVPSRFVLKNNITSYDRTIPVEADSLDFLRKMWGPSVGISPTTGGPLPLNWNAAWQGTDPTKTTLSVTLEGDQCLVFFLGGIPSGGSPLTCLGFSTVQRNPTDFSTGDKIAPLFEFKPSQLTDPGRKAAPGFYAYNDPYGTPYAFFSSYKKENGYNRYSSTDCPSLGVSAYLKTSSPLLFWNERSFQIISAGPDKAFGPGGVVWGPNNPNTGVGADDMSNFHDRTLDAVD